MPRKKTDQLDDILNYMTNAPLAGVDVVLRLSATIVKNRHVAEDPPEKKPVVRRRRRSAQAAVDAIQPAAIAPAPTVDAPKPKRTRRKKGEAAASTATPVGPTITPVADEADGGETYSES